MQHPLLRYLLIATPLCALLFLTLAGFFTQWDGRAVSHRPSPGERAAVQTVLIVTDGGKRTEVDWPADLVRELSLPVDPTGTPPNRIPEDAPQTRKHVGKFAFAVTVGGERREVTPNLSLSLSAAVLAWVLGLALFNMWRSGSPFSWEARQHVLPASQDANLQVAGTPETRNVSRPGPPPPRRRRGGGRRR